MGFSNSRSQWGGLAFVLLIATLFRLVAIDKQGLDTDEAWTLALSQWTPWEMITQPTDTHPFLYYALHGALFSPEDTAASMRLLPVFFGVMAVAVMYLLGRLHFGVRGGLLSAALLAVWAPHVDYSMEVRNYAAFFFFVLLICYGFSLYWVMPSGDAPSADRDRARLTGLALLCAGCVLSFYTHIVSVFPIALFCAAMWLWAVLYARERLAEVSAAFCAMAVLAVPGILWAMKLSGADHPFDWWPQPGLTTFVSTMADFFFPIGFWDNALTNAEDIRLMAKTAAIGICSVLLVILAVARRHQAAESIRRNPALGVVMAALLVLPLIIWSLGFVAMPIFMGRTILFCVPGLILLLTAMVAPLRTGKEIVTGIVIFAVYAASTVSYGFMRERIDWRGAVAFLEENVGPDDYIGLSPSYNYLTISSPASKPTGAGLWVTSRSGKSVIAQHALGDEPDWVRDYYLTLEKHERTEHVTIDLPPGTTIWRVDGPIAPGSVQMSAQNSLFARIGDPETVWSQTSRYEGGNWLSIRRYRTSEPLSLEMERMVDAGAAR